MKISVHVPLVALLSLGLMHLGSRAFLAFLVEEGALMNTSKRSEAG